MSRPVLHLLPGEVFCPAHPHLITTILGSCVAVCLWDRRLRHGGMSHSILPEAADEPSSARYTDSAIDLLIARMGVLGSRRSDIEAKLFGGGKVLPASDHPASAIGARNVRAALDSLKRNGLDLSGARVSGTSGVVIRQDTGTGEIWLRTVANDAYAAPTPRPGPHFTTQQSDGSHGWNHV